VTGELRRFQGRTSAAINPWLGIGPGFGMADAPVAEDG
jgi:hypothetical protein